MTAVLCRTIPRSAQLCFAAFGSPSLLPWQMNNTFIIVLFLLVLPRNALILQGISRIFCYALELQIVANQSKIEQVGTAC